MITCHFCGLPIEFDRITVRRPDGPCIMTLRRGPFVVAVVQPDPNLLIVDVDPEPEPIIACWCIGRLE